MNILKRVAGREEKHKLQIKGDFRLRYETKFFNIKQTLRLPTFVASHRFCVDISISFSVWPIGQIRTNHDNKVVSTFKVWGVMLLMIIVNIIGVQIEKKKLKREKRVFRACNFFFFRFI